MKLIMENWDKFLNEAVKPIHGHGDVEKAIEDAMSYAGISGRGLFILMKEISIVESGYKPKSVIGHVKNPFQMTDIAIDEIRNIDGEGYRRVKKYIKNFERNTKIKRRMMQPWHKQGNEEIKKFLLLNAAASMFYIIRMGGLKSVSNLNSRANWWKTKYNTKKGAGTPNYYQEKIKQFLYTTSRRE
jgi:hypothetical protein